MFCSDELPQEGPSRIHIRCQKDLSDLKIFLKCCDLIKCNFSGEETGKREGQDGKKIVEL